MRRAIGAAGLAAALGVLVVVPSMAASPSTQVKSVELFTVGAHTSVDVAVRYPDAGSRKVSGHATNRGVVALVVRDAAGDVLARRRASARLPVDVPRAASVVHTYRFALPAGVADVGGLTIDVAAEGTLDPDGPGPADAAVDTDTDTVDAAAVQDVTSAPPVYQYHVVRFVSRGVCNLYATNACAGYFLNGADSDAPFQNNGKTGATLLINYTGGHVALKFIESSTHDSISGSVASLAHAEYPVVVMAPPWGKGPGFSGSTGPAGSSGGPLYLKVDNGPGGGDHTWSMWGYIRYNG